MFDTSSNATHARLRLRSPVARPRLRSLSGSSRARYDAQHRFLPSNLSRAFIHTRTPTSTPGSQPNSRCLRMFISAPELCPSERGRVSFGTLSVHTGSCSFVACPRSPLSRTRCSELRAARTRHPPGCSHLLAITSSSTRLPRSQASHVPILVPRESTQPAVGP